MKRLFLFLLFASAFPVLTSMGKSLLKSFDKEKLGNMLKSEFPLTAHDTMTLNELNTLRALIAKGTIADAVKTIARIIYVVGKAVEFFVDGIAKAWGAIKDTLKIVGGVLEEGWNAIVDTGGVVLNAVLSIEDAIIDLGSEIADGFIDFTNAIGNFFGKKRRRRNSNGKKHNGSDFNILNHENDELDTLSFELGIPRHTLGPASDMNILVWNRRLAQLAAVKQKEYDQGVRTVKHNEKLYRMFAHGGFFDYIVSNFLGKLISTLFTHVKIAYYACYLIFSGYDAPIYDLDAIKDTILEALYANSVEVGCVVAHPNSFCVIGPIVERDDNLFYEKGTNATNCRYGHNESLCLPPPSYFFALRDRYERRLRPKISKYEILDGFNSSSNSSEFSVEWPAEDDYSNPSLTIFNVFALLLAKLLL